MTTITISAWKSCLYREVFIITEYRDGCVFKTKTTGKYILGIQEQDLPKDHIAVSVSTKMYTDKAEVKLSLFFA